MDRQRATQSPELAVRSDICHSMSIIGGLNMLNIRGSVVILRQKIDSDVFVGLGSGRGSYLA